MNKRRRRARRRAARLRRIGFFAVLLIPAVLAAALLCQACGQDGDAAHEETVGETVGASALPGGWACRTMTEAGQAEGTLVLVNRDHAFDPAAVHTESVYADKSDSYYVYDTLLSLRPEVIPALNAWMDAFSEATGLRNINLVAGYRTKEIQQTLYDNAVQRKGQAHAAQYLALPGHSEHHTGLALDLDTYLPESGASGGFDGSGAYAWAAEHAWEFGFVRRYPAEKSGITGIADEAWHYRYVGLPHSAWMTEKNLCLEEYLDLLRDYPFDGAHLTLDSMGAPSKG